MSADEKFSRNDTSMRRISAITLMLALPAAFGACTTFATVRSAEVRAGPSFATHASVTTPAGEVASWFWTIECAANCNQAILGGDIGYTHGWRRAGSPRAVALGAGLNGFYPYVDGYIQMSSGSRPFGVGARVGLPVQSWRSHQLYARYDIPLSANTRLLVNPALLLHEGETPSGQTSGHFLGFVQGLGLEIVGKYASFTPAVAIVAARAQRQNSFSRFGPQGSVFATASLGLTFHRASPAISR